MEEKNMVRAKTLIAVIGLLAVTAALPAYSADSVKLLGTRFEMDVPQNWQPGYKDLDDRLLMVFFKDAKSGATLEGVYLRKVQPATFTLDDFKKWRIGAEDKRYEGKGHHVVKEDSITIGGETGNYLLTGWKDGATDFEKHTAQYLKDGRQYMVVFWGPKGRIDKSVFDHAVKSFGLGKE
jgi:hypothetical protein